MPTRSNPPTQWTEPPERGGISVSIVAGYLYEGYVGEYGLTSDPLEGVAAFNKVGDDLVIVPRTELDGTAHLLMRPGGDFFVMS